MFDGSDEEEGGMKILSLLQLPELGLLMNCAEDWW